jgi:hypothetical protein
MEEQRLRSGFLADIDRPGPLPSVVNALHRILPIPRLHQYLRKRHGAVMLLPSRGQGPGTSEEWKTEVGQILRDFRRERSGLPCWQQSSHPIQTTSPQKRPTNSYSPRTAPRRGVHLVCLGFGVVRRQREPRALPGWFWAQRRQVARSVAINAARSLSAVSGVVAWAGWRM